MEHNHAYIKGFLPYALAAFLIGIVGGFSTVLGPAFVQDIGIAYNNTTWTALAQAMSTAACAPILGKVGDVIGRRRTLLLGVAVFTLGNVLSALANSLVPNHGDEIAAVFANIEFLLHKLPPSKESVS
jgi:predicted MFS family arabinose efflux permease